MISLLYIHIYIIYRYIYTHTYINIYIHTNKTFKFGDFPRKEDAFSRNYRHWVWSLGERVAILGAEAEAVEVPTLEAW